MEYDSAEKRTQIIRDGAKKLVNRLADLVIQHLDPSEFYQIKDKYTNQIHTAIILEALKLLPEVIKSKLEKKG